MTNSKIAKALAYKKHYIDIYSISSGHDDGDHDFSYPNAQVNNALYTGVTEVNEIVKRGHLNLLG